MLYDSIDEIIKEFSLKPDNLVDMRRELIKNISAIHPDRNNGIFQNIETENLYKKTNEAIQYIDNKLKNENQLVPISSLTEIIKIVQDIIPKNEEAQVNKTFMIEQKINNNLDDWRNDYLSKYKGSKIISSGIALLITTIWLFPSTINEHPILSEYINTNNFIFLLLWLTSIGITSIIWLYSKYKENKIKYLVKKLKTETYQNQLFNEFILLGHKRNEYIRRDYYEREFSYDENNFTKNQLINFIISPYFLNYYRNDFRRNIFRQSFIDYEIANEIANIILIRAEEKRIIKKKDIVSLTDVYEIII
jgi:hypothetical protein